MRTVYWGQVSDGSCEPETWNEFEVETTADKTEVRRQVIENGIFADPPELRLLLSSNAWCKWDKVQTLPAGDCKIKVIYRTSGSQISYFIPPHIQNAVRAAVFYIVGEGHEGVGVGVFFSRTKAVTADHNFTSEHGEGTKVSVKIPGLEEQLILTLSVRNEELDYAILVCAHDHAFIPTYQDDVQALTGADLVLAMCHRFGIEEHALFRHNLGFTRAASIVLSRDNMHLFLGCPAFAGDSGAPLILKGGLLVGIHQAAVNALRKRLQHAKTIKYRLTAPEESIDVIVNGGLAQGHCALLSHVFSA